ncbi:GntR family transcriptional regulator [Saccharopolyspora sp. NPDC047091]|uniref:GntR family transcriptional regulator n=1 Tax=Saccharopolyspora sp. NPDC047091 TaxID=3155924 RepID=UPI0033E7DA23
MYKQVSPGKRQQIVDTLAQRIRDGHYRLGEKLDGELRLAEEFEVSRGTVRQALNELQHLRLIATESGRGSFVIFNGHQLSQDRGWAQSLADSGSEITVAVLGLERVERADVPLLPPEVRLERGIAIRRVRILRSADGVEPISFECSTVPAEGTLGQLPETGLVKGSISQTLAQAGYLLTRGTQRADVHWLDEREAGILHRETGSAFLRTARTSFTDDGRFAEHVVSLLDPRYFTLALNFGDQR